ncbi:MAG: hypothetical protein NTW26_00275 [bacterium]|nr:hypothetical protein [bacterium]
MKKVILAALMLVLITSVAWANEITLSADSNGRTAVVGNEAGIVPAISNGEDNAGQILIWDNGVMGDYWPDSYSRAVQFTAPTDCHVTMGMVYVYDTAMEYPPFYLAIYNDNEGLPGDELGGMASRSGGGEGWHKTNTIPAGITLNEGDVFYTTVVKLSGGHPYFCADTTDPESSHGSFYFDGTEWLTEDSNLMIRVVVDDDVTGPYSDNANPAPGDSGIHGDTSISFELHDDGHDLSLPTVIVVIDGDEVTDQCSITMLNLGGCLVSFTPEKDFDAGDINVWWYCEDVLGNGNEDTWFFTVEDFSDDSAVEDTSWGVIKDKF